MNRTKYQIGDYIQVNCDFLKYNKCSLKSFHNFIVVDIKDDEIRPAIYTLKQPKGIGIPYYVGFMFQAREINLISKKLTDGHLVNLLFNNE